MNAWNTIIVRKKILKQLRKKYEYKRTMNAIPKPQGII